ELLFGGQALECPHRGLQNGLGLLLGPLLRGLHRFSVVALELRVMIPQALDLLSQRTRVPALTDDEGDGADEGDEESPEQWVPCVFRHKTLFRRLTAGLLIVPSLRAVADRPPGLPPGPS